MTMLKLLRSYSDPSEECKWRELDVQDSKHYTFVVLFCKLLVSVAEAYIYLRYIGRIFLMTPAQTINNYNYIPDFYWNSIQT